MSASAPPSAPIKSPIDTAREIAGHTSQLVRLELELKLLELRRKATELGISAGLGLVAVLLVPLIILFLLAAAAAGLATTMPVWGAILIVAGLLILVAAGLAGAAVVIAKSALKKKEVGGAGA